LCSALFLIWSTEERDEETVTVQLDDEESVIQFVDAPGFDIGKSGPSGNAAENRFDVRQVDSYKTT